MKDKIKLIVTIALLLMSVAIAVITATGRPTSLSTYLPHVSMGIDLKGGHRLVLGVRDDDIKQNVDQRLSEFFLFHDANTSSVSNSTHDISLVGIYSAESINQFMVEYPSLSVTKTDVGVDIDGVDKLLSAERAELIKSNIQVINSRLNALGTSDVTVFKQGDRKIVVELPIDVDYEKTKALLTSTSKIGFFLESREAGGHQLSYKGASISRQTLPIINGDAVTDAYAAVDAQMGLPTVNIRLSGSAGKIMEDVSGKNIGQPIITTLTEQNKNTLGEWVKTEVVINVATIRSQLGRSFQVSGIDNGKAATSLAIQLKSGALSVPMDTILEKNIDPRLGAENVKAGLEAFVIGILFLFAFIIYHYGLFGAAACFTLALNVSFIVFMLALFDSSFTLTGIAGLVLTMGIAVDANIIIFERYLETKAQDGVDDIKLAFERSFATVADANVTTLIASLILFNVGSIALKGFAITLGLGVISTMLCCYVINKYLLVSFCKIRGSNAK